MTSTEQRSDRHHPVRVVATVIGAGVLLYAAAIVFVLGAIVTTGCLMGCSTPSPLPGTIAIAGAAGLGTASIALLTWMVAPTALRRVGRRGWVDTTAVLWGAATTWALWATGWQRLDGSGRGLLAVTLATVAWRLVPAVHALRRGRAPDDPLPLPHHLPTWARRTLRTLGLLAGLWALVIAWGAWSYSQHFSPSAAPLPEVTQFLALGLSVPAATWTATSQTLHRWVLATVLAASVGVGLALLLAVA